MTIYYWNMKCDIGKLLIKMFVADDVRPSNINVIFLTGQFTRAFSYLMTYTCVFLTSVIIWLCQAPMSECWEQMGVGMKVEVACGAEAVTKDAYWIATVLGIAGNISSLLCFFGLS